MLGFLHEAAAGVVLRDLRHRAAHVDVDDVGAHAFDDARGFGHLVGSPPKIWIETGRSSMVYPANSSVRSMPRISPSELTISDTTRPQPPWRFTRRRKAESVMPAIGATPSGWSSVADPI